MGELADIVREAGAWNVAMLQDLSYIENAQGKLDIKTGCKYRMAVMRVEHILEHFKHNMSGRCYTHYVNLYHSALKKE